METNKVTAAQEMYLKIKRALSGPEKNSYTDESWVLPALNFRLQAKYPVPPVVVTGDPVTLEKRKKSTPGTDKK